MACCAKGKETARFGSPHPALGSREGGWRLVPSKLGLGGRARFGQRQRAQVQGDAHVKRDEEATGVRGEEVFLVGALGPELPW